MLDLWQSWPCCGVVTRGVNNNFHALGEDEPENIDGTLDSGEVLQAWCLFRALQWSVESNHNSRSKKIIDVMD